MDERERLLDSGLGEELEKHRCPTRKAQRLCAISKTSKYSRPLSVLLNAFLPLRFGPQMSDRYRQVQATRETFQKGRKHDAVHTTLPDCISFYLYWSCLNS